MYIQRNVANNPLTDNVQVFYPDISFSNCLINREGNYWFTTLQSGMMRIPDLNYIVWNNSECSKISKIATDGKNIFYSNINGIIGKLNTENNELKTFQTYGNADIQCLNYDTYNKRLFFYINNNLYALNKNNIELIIQEVPPTKFITKAGKSYVLCSSFGTYLYDIDRKKQLKKIHPSWTRQALFDQKNNLLWLAGNSGLYRVDILNDMYILSDSFIINKQIVSIDIDKHSQTLYSLTFDGKIFLIDKHINQKPLAQLPDDVVPYQLKFYKNDLYIATNKGLWIHNIRQNKFERLNTLSGLASENIQDILVLKENLWLGTGKGLQKIPLRPKKEKSFAKIYLKNNNDSLSNIRIDYGEQIVLYPEASIYNSNGKFEYAYRINENEWVKLPSSIQQIEIQNLPTGNLNIKLKVIDHLGNDSENIIILKGYVSPPFGKTIWFIVIIILLFLSLVYMLFKHQWKKRQKQWQEQNELNSMKLSAIKAQMNPHFIFNVLSSIKGYIYENDRQRAGAYLDAFADLIRTVLEMSEVQFVSLTDELKTLKLYIDLEGMMLEDFYCEINTSNTINTSEVKIPALILQPYVENAFKHGLRHKLGKKKLLINITPLEFYALQIEISDNGIGRKAAKELNSKNSLRSKPFATQALDKRIALINRSEEIKMSVNIIDLFSEKSQETGTKIILTLNRVQK